MSYHFTKHFTVAQANAMIPHIRRLFAEVKVLMSKPDGTRVNIENAGSKDHAVPVATNGNGNGNGYHNGMTTQKSSATDYSSWSNEKRREAAYRLLNALQSQGIVIQDVERGLIDFPAIIDNREVFLCYELQDGLSITHFHELDAGFAGRQPITETDSD